MGSTSIRLWLTLPRKGIDAVGLWFPETNEFQILKGSSAARIDVRSMKELYRDKKASLIKQGILVRGSYDWNFSQNYTFASASEAACIVCGNSRNGFSSWVDAEDKTLNDIGYYR